MLATTLSTAVGMTTSFIKNINKFFEAYKNKYNDEMIKKNYENLNLSSKIKFEKIIQNYILEEEKWPVIHSIISKAIFTQENTDIKEKNLEDHMNLILILSKESLFEIIRWAAMFPGDINEYHSDYFDNSGLPHKDKKTLIDFGVLKEKFNDRKIPMRTLVFTDKLLQIAFLIQPQLEPNFHNYNIDFEKSDIFEKDWEDFFEITNKKISNATELAEFMINFYRNYEPTLINKDKITKIKKWLFQHRRILCYQADFSLSKNYHILNMALSMSGDQGTQNNFKEAIAYTRSINLK